MSAVKDKNQFYSLTNGSGSNTLLPMQTFKSERAAKMAYNKADRAYVEARDAKRWYVAEHGPFAEATAEDVGEWADEARMHAVKLAELEAAEQAAWQTMRDIFDAARAQSLSVWSFWFSADSVSSRELASNNVD